MNADSQLRLSDIYIGDIDAKNELLKQSTIDARVFMNGFFVPQNFVSGDFDAGNVMYVVGFKGTGKTSFLRWLADKRARDGNYAHFLLFKSELLEEDRQAISRGVWFEVLPIRKDLSAIEQDFKYAWSWILLEKLFAALLKDRHSCVRDVRFEDAARAIGHDIGSGRSVLLRADGSLLPRLKSGSVEIDSDSLGPEGRKARGSAKVPFGDLVRSARDAVTRITYTGKKVFLFIDELEAFSTSQENFERDIRMIRDLLHAVYDLNTHFRHHKVPIFIVAAVRSEVLAVVDRIGQEIGRDVQDFSMRVDWSQGRRAPDHLLMRLMELKIKASEIQRFGKVKNHHPLQTYFPSAVSGMPVHNYLLDFSMYRPRDIVRRLGLVRRAYPNDWKFTEDALRGTSDEYSRQMWQEAREELVPGYNPEEVVGLEQAFIGFKRYFYLRQFEETLMDSSRRNAALRSLLERHPPQQILRDLFRLGVVGNHILTGDAKRSGVHSRWAFRGDTTLAIERRMAFHKCLWPNFSLVAS